MRRVGEGLMVPLGEVGEGSAGGMRCVTLLT
jgi:hypothetical protein